MKPESRFRRAVVTWQWLISAGSAEPVRPFRNACAAAGLSLLIAAPCSAQEPPKQPPANGAAAAGGETAAVDLSKPLDPANFAEYVCESEVHFSWRQHPTTLPDGTSETPEPQQVYYGRVGERGQNGLEVKARLEAKLSGIKADAIALCRRQHEDLSSCISSRLRNTGADYTLLDFGARRALLDAITSDCKTAQGNCLTAENNEIQCFVATPPDLPPKSAEAADEKADKGKKEKKK